jgi:hypothetical protein
MFENLSEYWRLRAFYNSHIRLPFATRDLFIVVKVKWLDFHWEHTWALKDPNSTVL